MHQNFEIYINRWKKRFNKQLKGIIYGKAKYSIKAVTRFKWVFNSKISNVKLHIEVKIKLFWVHCKLCNIREMITGAPTLVKDMKKEII